MEAVQGQGARAVGPAHRRRRGCRHGAPRSAHREDPGAVRDHPRRGGSRDQRVARDARGIATLDQRFRTTQGPSTGLPTGLGGSPPNPLPLMEGPSFFGLRPAEGRQCERPMPAARDSAQVSERPRRHHRRGLVVSGTRILLAVAPRRETTRGVSMTASRSLFSSLSHRMADFSSAVTEWTGGTAAFLLAFGAIVVWLVTGPLFGFSDTWQLVINTATTIVTFLMVFLIQRAQNKSARAMALKLNELIAAVEGASNRLIDAD